MQKFNYHSHTYRCGHADLDFIDEEYIQEYIKMGFKKIAYPCKEFWEVVSNYNIKVLYGLDTHHRGQILLWNELIELSHKILGKELIEKLNFIK